MAIENYQQIRARDLGLPMGTGKDYTKADLVPFIEEVERVEGERQTSRFTRNLVVAFTTPPALALLCSCFPPSEIRVLDTLRTAAYMVTAGEIGWVGGGIIIEGGRAFKRAITSRLPQHNQ